jgi:hypothetical protein
MTEIIEAEKEEIKRLKDEEDKKEL